MENKIQKEVFEIHERYRRREGLSSYLYSILNPSIMMTLQERERILIKWINTSLKGGLAEKFLLEVGCGDGYNLLKFIELGFKPINLIGNELLPARVEKARGLLPSQVKIIEGNALNMEIEPSSLDIVFQSTVFSSILSDEFQEALAKKMMEWIKPDGGILWYDFIYNNPGNKDVRGVPLSRIRTLFPGMNVRYWRLTLAPPISRMVVKVHPAMYSLFNLMPFLRTHVLCWITNK